MFFIDMFVSSCNKSVRLLLQMFRKAYYEFRAGIAQSV
jgi:hypothetical protein